MEDKKFIPDEVKKIMFSSGDIASEILEYVRIDAIRFHKWIEEDVDVTHKWCWKNPHLELRYWYKEELKTIEELYDIYIKEQQP